MTLKISLPAELMTAANDLVIGGTNGTPTRLASVASRFLGTDTNGNISWTTVPVDPAATTTTLGTVSIDALPTSGNPVAITSAGYLTSLTNLTHSNFSTSAGITSGQIASVNPSALTGSGTIPPVALASVGSVSNGQVLTWQTGGTMAWTTVTSGGSGSVTSVGLTVPGILFSVSNSPITSSGNLALSLLTQTANTILAGPTTGSAAAPTMRTLVDADIPTGITASKINGALSNATLAGSALTGTGVIPPATLASVASVSNGQVLTWNTGGTLSWTTPSGGSASSIDGGTF